MVHLAGMSSIAFLGTGLLGGAFVEAALERGESVTVWNRTRAKADALTAFGARVAETPAEAVRGAERVHLVLRDDAVVDAVIDELRPGLGDDAIIVDHTTTQPALTAARAARLAGDGVRYLHCPVFIGPPAARKAQGAILVAGPQALFDVVRPALERQAQKVWYVGERSDLAAAYKLMGNCYIVGVAALIADVLAIAKGSDVAPKEALEVLRLFDGVNIVAGRGAKMAAGDFTPSFELPMARKDVRLMMETAGDLPLAVLPALAARMDAVIAAGQSAFDFSVIAKDLV